MLVREFPSRASIRSCACSEDSRAGFYEGLLVNV